MILRLFELMLLFAVAFTACILLPLLWFRLLGVLLGGPL